MEVIKVREERKGSKSNRKTYLSMPKQSRYRKKSAQMPTQIQPATPYNVVSHSKQTNNVSITSIMQSIPLIAEYKQHQIVQNRIRSKEQILRIWKIGKYISHGSTATVYKAFNNFTGQLVAVKKIIFDEKDSQLHKKQLKILCKLHHKNVVKYVEHQQVHNETWIFMEYIPNTLQWFLRDYGIPPLQNYLYLAKQIITAVDYLHSQKIVHRDIKCSNILLDDDGIVKLSDFGCSKGFNQTLSLLNYEQEGCRTFKGSILWMAPEVIRSSIYNRKTDVWSLGCTLLEMATGKSPWHQKNFDNQMTALWSIAQDGQVPEIPSYLHTDIKYLIGSCIKRDPQERFSTKQLLKADFFNKVL